jgi:hypothetical protein
MIEQHKEIFEQFRYITIAQERDLPDDIRFIENKFSIELPPEVLELISYLRTLRMDENDFGILWHDLIGTKNSSIIQKELEIDKGSSYIKTKRERLRTLLTEYSSLPYQNYWNRSFVETKNRNRSMMLFPLLTIKEGGEFKIEDIDIFLSDPTDKLIFKILIYYIGIGGTKAKERLNEMIATNQKLKDSINRGHIQSPSIPKLYAKIEECIKAFGCKSEEEFQIHPYVLTERMKILRRQRELYMATLNQ